MKSEELRGRSFALVGFSLITKIFFFVYVPRALWLELFTKISLSGSYTPCDLYVS